MQRLMSWLGLACSSRQTGRAKLQLEQLEARDVPSVTPVGDPGMTRQTAYHVGPVTATARSFSASITPGADVDVFALDLRAGQTISIGIRDSWNHLQGKQARGLRSEVRIFTPEGKFTTELDPAPHNHPEFDRFLIFRPSHAGTYYIGVSAAGNGGYNIVSGKGAQVPRENKADQGSYVITFAANG